LGVERADGEGMDAALSARASRKAPGRGAKALRRFWQYLAIGDDICHMIVQRSMADTPPQPPAARFSRPRQVRDEPEALLSPEAPFHAGRFEPARRARPFFGAFAARL